VLSLSRFFNLDFSKVNWTHIQRFSDELCHPQIAWAYFDACAKSVHPRVSPRRIILWLYQPPSKHYLLGGAAFATLSLARVCQQSRCAIMRTRTRSFMSQLPAITLPWIRLWLARRAPWSRRRRNPIDIISVPKVRSLSLSSAQNITDIPIYKWPGLRWPP